MAIQIGLGFFIALGLNAPGLRLKRVYKTLLMVPWAVPAYISILLWRVGMFNTEFGILNKFLAMLGFDKVDFLASNGIAFLSWTAVFTRAPPWTGRGSGCGPGPSQCPLSVPSSPRQR